LAATIATIARGSAAARQRGSAAARQRGSAAARQLGLERVNGDHAGRPRRAA